MTSKINFGKIRQDYFPLGGGLDLVTPSIAIEPGKVIDSQNYEMAIGGGYRHLETGHRFSAVAELPARTTVSCQLNQFDQADLILWQARHMADEWRGSLKTHLRFGSVATELRCVAQTESAALLLLGCESAAHPLVEQLGTDLPCAILGIPPAASS